MRLRRRKARPLLPVDVPLGVPPKRRWLIRLLPNMFTLAALFAAFFAVVQAMHGRFEVSAVAIFAAMLLDGMDGRVARMTNTQSAFGEQLDSLADMVSFGVAPALVIYEWLLKDLGRVGWAAAFVYCACAALRLARFNSNLGVVDKRFFQGLPSPAAAALIAGFVWLVIDNKIRLTDAAMPWVGTALTLYAGLTMVSSAPFYSGKSFHFSRSVPFWVLVVALLLIFFVLVDPPIALFALFCAYALSGYVYGAWRWWRGEANPAKPKPPAPTAEAK
ncbi:MAG: CDP-diacylglycerol--serine O-phosphatidyltransferase [Betaproteobacteria bacterium]